MKYPDVIFEIVDLRNDEVLATAPSALAAMKVQELWNEAKPQGTYLRVMVTDEEQPNDDQS